MISDLNQLTNSYLAFTLFKRRMIRGKSSMILKLKQTIKKVLETKAKETYYLYHITIMQNTVLFI